MSESETGFSLNQALAARDALRRSLGLGEERFPVEAFVGMISDEIEQMREAGRSDGAIAALVAKASGREIDPADIAQFYATPEERAHGRG